MKGKRVFITGGNSGIGLVAASELAKQGAEIVLACKPSKKTDLAVSFLNSASSVPVTNLDVDLASLESVRNLAARFLEKYDSLDVLINNAGIFPPKQRFTLDGFEMQFGVNHLAHFLLTNLLIDCLEKTSPSRVITVSSMLHKKWIVRKIIGMLFMSPEKGAKTTVMLASDPSMEKETGNYYDQTKLDECSPLGHDEELRKSLWDQSAELVNL